MKQLKALLAAEIIGTLDRLVGILNRLGSRVEVKVENQAGDKHGPRSLGRAAVITFWLHLSVFYLGGEGIADEW